MTPETRRQKIQSYANAYTQLVNALDKFPREMWQFRDEHGCWSIHEHIIHITDSEANSYIRCPPSHRRAGPHPHGLRREPVGRRPRVPRAGHRRRPQPVQMAPQQDLHALIKSLPESTWANTAYHPENGDMTLDDWLDTYESHVREHLEYMQQNLEAWQAQQP